MRLCWKLLLSLGLFWSSILGVAQDFTPFFGKLTQAEYQDRLEKWMVADGKQCDTAGRAETLVYLKRHFVETAEGLQVYADSQSKTLLTTIPWRAEAIEESQPTTYTLILDPGKERDVITFTGEKTGTFGYKEAMASATLLVQEKFRTAPHLRINKIFSTSDVRPMPTTLAEGKAAAQILIRAAPSSVLLLSVHMNVSILPTGSGDVPVSPQFPHIVSFVPGGYMKDELKGEAARIHLFLQQLFFEQISTSIALAQQMNAEIQKAFPSTSLLDAAIARQIKAFDLHTCPVIDAPGVQCRNLAMTALPDAACVYTFGPCYNHPEVVDVCVEANRDRDTGLLPISRILADAIYNGIIRFLDGPAAPAHATVPE